MKHFFEVFFIAVTLVAFSLGNVPVGIFGAMFAVIAWMAPLKKNCKTPDQIFADATGQENSNVEVVYEFRAAPGESFTAKLHLYTVDDSKVLATLAEYVSEHSGIPITGDRLHVSSYKVV
jgi:hypothetical protein